MWNSNMIPTPLTIDSLRTSRKRRLEGNQREKKFSKDKFKKKIRPSQPDPSLKSGRHLPSYMRLFFSPELINVLLEDLDPFYADKETFVIVADKKLLHRFSAQNALNLFSPFNPVRRACISVLHNWIYHWFMIMIAFVDCCLLAQPKNYHQPLVFYFFGATYTFDFVTNVIASGLILDRFAFLRDGWGIVDLLLLVPYYIPHIGRHHFLCGLRALKIAALIPSLQSAIKAVIKTARDLRDMFLWALLATWIFTLVGYHFYMGVSPSKCVRNFPEDGSVGETRDLKWHNWISNSSNLIEKWWEPGDYRACGNYSMSRDYQCDKDYTCLHIPHNGDKLYGSFDRALLSTLRVMLQDTWDDIYFVILRTGGPWHALYFVATLMFVSFYTLNMILGVVSKSYFHIQKELKQAEKLESIICKHSTSNISGSNDGDDAKENDDHETNTAGFNFFIAYRVSIQNVWKWLKNLLHVVAFDPFTEVIMAVAIVGNVVLLSLDRYEADENEQNPELQRIVVSGRQIFGIMFATECLLKSVACGPVSYLKDKWNIFDLSQTILFLVELKLDYHTGWMNALLSLRSLRIFKLARIWPILDSMLNGVFSVMGNISDMTIVSIGVFYMFCVAGVHLFGENIETRHPKSNWHFRDFWHSFLVIFRLVCGEWADSMSNCVDDHGWICIPFFISAVVVLDMIVLSLLLVMFLQRFSTRNSSTNNSNSDVNKVAIAISRFCRLWICIKRKFGTCLRRTANRNNQSDSTIREEQNNEVEAFVYNKTIFGCPQLRVKLQGLTNSNLFKYFNIGNTIIATICLSLRDAHLKSRPQLENILTVAENITLFFMAAEALIKIIAVGFSAYIKNKWDQLDLFIVLSGILNIILSVVGYGSVAFFRSMRVLRLVSNFEGMRNLFSSLGRTMRQICGTLLVCLIIWLVFAIVGVQLFKGRFQGCYEKRSRKIVDVRIIRNKVECRHFKSYLDWKFSVFNFDNVRSAYFRVLEIITFKGWASTFDWATSSGEIEEQISFEKNFWLSGYFVAVGLFGSFFAFNLFTGALIDGLNEEKAKTDGSATKLRMESGYLKARKIMLDKLRIKLSSAGAKTGKYQKFVLGFVTSKQFKIFILLNYGIHMVSLSMEQRNNPYKDAILILNGICTAGFAIEALLNMFAQGGKIIRNPRRIFELLTELLSVCDILWTELLLKTSYFPFSPSLLRLIRFAWVSRYLRHFKAANGLRNLISLLKISLPTFLNICVLLLLITFIYATLGMEIFKGVRFDCCDSVEYEVSFETLLSSLISLFPLVSSAGWDMFLVIVTVRTTCTLVPESEKTWYCGNNTVAATFVISYLFITFVILVNMFSAVILDNYSEVIKCVECELRDEHFERFYEVWALFDTETSHFIDHNFLSDIFESFEPPFHVSQPNCVAISLMNVPIYEGNVVHCADVMDAAITYFYFRKGVVPAERFNEYQDEMKDDKNCKLEISSSTFRLQQERRCAIIIQRAWRNHISILSE